MADPTYRTRPGSAVSAADTAADAAAAQRRLRIRQVVEDCLCRRAAGEALSDNEVCAAHAALMPELGHALRGLALIERARSAAVDELARPPFDSAPDIPANTIPGYELLREIHRGGQGVVYRALQKSTGRKVALKVLLDGAFAGPLDRSRFEREVKVLAALRHPNIVNIYDSGSASGRFYFVMDYIPGQPLDVYMSSEPRSIARTLHLFTKICTAVGAAHLQGIIHRDLKPGNIRVDEGGEPTILDFGLAKLMAAASVGENAGAPGETQTGQFVGSLPWSAPEQAEGAPARIDTRTDVYALGIVLYHMLTGKFPYGVVGPMHEVVQRIVHEAPQPPRPLRPEIDDELATIMLKCLSKERERRYQTAGELGRDVERYLRGEPIEAKRDSGWYVLRKSLRRFRAAVAIGALFVLLLMVSTAVGWTLWRKAEHSAVAEGQRAAEARENLRASLLAQARAVRKTGQAGQRFKALEAIAEAAAIRPGLELRNEMVAALAVTDVRIRPTALQIAGTTRFDASFERCAVLQEPGQSVCVVRLSDGLPIAHIPAIPPGSSEVYKLALAGDFLARVFDPPQAARRLEVWSIASGQLRWALDDVPPMGGFDISPDMTTLAVARLDSAVHLYDLATAAPLQRYALDRLPSRMNFDPAGRRLALFHGAYLSAEILDLHTGELCPAFGTTPISWSVAWTPDGRILAGASASNIQLWDTVDRRSIGALRGHDAVIIAMGTTHDGLRLASCSWDGVTILWDLSSRQALLQIDGNLTAFAPDDRAIGGSAPLTDGPPGRAGLAILDLVGPQEFSTLQVLGDPDTLAGNRAGFAARAGLVISSVANDSLTMPQRTGDPPFDPSGLYLLDPVSSRQLAHLPIGPSMLLSGPRNSDAEFFVSFHRGRGLYRWPIQAPGAGSERAVRVGPPQALLRTSSCEGAALAGNGRLGAISERFGEVTVVYVQRPVDPSRFDCTAGRVVRELSSDGRWVVVLGWHLAGGEVWDSAAGRRVAELALSSHGRAAFTSDDRRLVTIDALGLQVWDTASWQSIAARPGAYGLLSFSGDGRMLAVTGRDQKITLLDGRTLEELCMLEAPQRFATTDVTFGPAGSVVQMSNHAGLGYIWDLRAIRARLAEIGLDWSHPPLAPAEPRPAVQRVEVDLGELAGPGAE